MNKIFLLALSSLIVISCSSPKSKSQKSGNWKEDSDEMLMSYANDLANVWPETASAFGISKFDAKTSAPSAKRDQDLFLLNYKWQQRLKKRLETELDEDLRIDIKILLKNTELEIEEHEVNRVVGIVRFMSPTRFILNRLKEKKKVSARFKGYVRGQKNSMPLITGLTAQMVSRMAYLEEKKKRGTWPQRFRIENYFKDSLQDIKAIEGIVKKSQVEDWQEDLEALKNQNAEFITFLKKKVLPFSSKNPTMHEKVYGVILRSNGVFMSPKDVIEKGKDDYKKTFTAYRKLARNIALLHHLKRNDPYDVSHYLRNKNFKSDIEAKELVAQKQKHFLKLIRDKNLLQVDKKPAYSQNLNEIKKSGFYHPDAIAGLVAHDFIPGKALRQMVDRIKAKTKIRTIYVSDIPSLESWGMYAEDIMFPYMSDEEKFFSLQRKLLIQARFSLDAQLNLGLADEQKVSEILSEDLGLPRELVNDEMNKFSTRPGTGPAYYYGFMTIMKIKRTLKTQAQGSFSEKCFNDELLAQGVLPTYIISDRLEKGLLCGPR